MEVEGGFRVEKGMELKGGEVRRKGASVYDSVYMFKVLLLLKCKYVGVYAFFNITFLMDGVGTRELEGG